MIESQKEMQQNMEFLTMSNLELIELIYFKMRIIFDHTSSMIFQNKPQNPFQPRTAQSWGRVKKMANEKKFLDPDPLLATQMFKSG